MRKMLFVLLLGMFLPFNFVCGDIPQPISPKPNSPAGLSAYRAYVFFQLSTGDNGNFYGVYSNENFGLNRKGMITASSGYWELVYGHIYGKQYKDGSWERLVHSDDYGTYTPLNQIWGGGVDSYNAVRIADAHGGSEYDNLYSVYIASKNGGLFGYPGETLWVVIYKLKSGDDLKRMFLIDAENGIFVKRMEYL